MIVSTWYGDKFNIFFSPWWPKYAIYKIVILNMKLVWHFFWPYQEKASFFKVLQKQFWPPGGQNMQYTENS